MSYITGWYIEEVSLSQDHTRYQIFVFRGDFDAIRRGSPISSTAVPAAEPIEYHQQYRH